MSKRIVIVQFSSRLDGSAFSGLLLARGLQDAGWDTHVAFAEDGPVIENYRKVNLKTYVVPHKNWLRRGKTHQFLKDFLTEYKKSKNFESLLEDISPDIMYINTVASLSGTIAAYRTDIPLVWHIREMFADIGGEMHAPFWGKSLVRTLINKMSDVLVANSSATAHNILGKRYSEIAHIVPNAVNDQYFQNQMSQENARKKLNLPQDKLIIGVPGTLRPMKGHPFLLKSIAPLLREREDITLAITGNGTEKYEQYLKNMVQDLGIAKKTIFLDWVSDMSEFYRACTIACIPSRAEPFGRTVIEAFASRLPVIATAVGGMKEIINHEENGLLVEYGNSEELQSAIKKILSNNDLRFSLAERALQDAKNNYHEKIYQNRLIGIINNAHFNDNVSESTEKYS